MAAVRLRNLGDAVHLYGPAGSPGSLHVESGQVVTVSGPLEETEDALICGEGGARRAFPKSRWAVDRPAKKAAAADGEKGDG